MSANSVATVCIQVAFMAAIATFIDIYNATGYTRQTALNLGSTIFEGGGGGGAPTSLPTSSFSSQLLKEYLLCDAENVTSC